MGSIILDRCRELKDLIDASGRVFNNTKEILTAITTIELIDVDLDKEEFFIRNYYGPKWEKRLADEIFHYKKLEYSLLHKIKEVAYFFKLPIENRKIVVFSEDCISFLQYIKRGTETILFCAMRSSDVLNLLPLDLLALGRILRSVNSTYGVTPTVEDLTVTIGSAHYYLEGGRD